jgi:hypothetical protein
MPAEILSTVVTHERVTKVRLHWPDFRLAIISQVQTVLGLDPHSVSSDIVIDAIVTPVEVAEGEPSEWTIDVTVTEDLS